MKKLVLFAAFAMSLSFFACGNGEKAAGNDSDSVANDTVAADTVAADTAAQDTVKAL